MLGTNTKKAFFLLACLLFQDYAYGSLVEDGILSNNINNNNTCLIYQPYLGVVKDIESLDIKSEKFEITDNEALILNGEVEIDFPEGLLKAGEAKIDRKKGLVDFKMDGDLFLEDYFFRAKEGSFNKDDRSIDLRYGQAFMNNRNLVLSFDQLKGNLNNTIALNQVSMTSCADVANGWEFVAENIELDDRSKRGYAKNVRIRILDRTVLKLPYIPFTTSSERMSGFLEP